MPFGAEQHAVPPGRLCCFSGICTIQRVALRKLILIDNAGSLEDLRIPPANHLEAMRGDRLGQYSIRINDQYRICFSAEGNNFYDVEIVDYH